MSVPEQLPIVSYIANGATTSFAITFDLHEDKYLLVTKNKELMPVGSYSIKDGSVIFGTAPITGDEITLARDTQLDRETNFKSYDNSFRPESINWDLDKLWHVLQEQNLIDAKILVRLKQEIEWRRTHDFNYDELAQVREKQLFDALKGYADTLNAATNPNIFQGVIAGVVFAKDGKSIQTHLEEILNNLTVSREDIDSKANQNYVDEQLNLKAPLTATNDLQEKKADLDYVNSIVSAAAEGTIPFKTEAELLLSKPTQSKVLAKALDTRHEFLWTRAEGVTPVTGTWIDTGLSDLDQAKVDATTKANAAFLESKSYTDTQAAKVDAKSYLNLINPTQATAQGYPNSSGEPNGTSSYKMYLDYIPATANQKLWFKRVSGGTVIGLYRADKTYITTLTINSTTTITLPTNNNIAYIRVSTNNADVVAGRANVVLGYGDTAPMGEPLYDVELIEVANTAFIKDMTSKIASSSEVKVVADSSAIAAVKTQINIYENLVNPNQETAQGYFQYGLPNGAAGFTTGLDYYPVKPNQKLWFEGFSGGGDYIAYYDELKRWSGGVHTRTLVNNILTVPATVDYGRIPAYMRICTGGDATMFTSGKISLGYADVLPVHIPAHGEKYSEPADAFAVGIKNKIARTDNPLYGKKWVAIGDSITAYAKCYANVLAERAGVTLSKLAEGGGQVHRSAGTSAWIASEQYINIGGAVVYNPTTQTWDKVDAITPPNLITIALGTNDVVNTDLELGVFSDRVNTTFYGALHVLISGLQSRFPNARIGYIAPIAGKSRRFLFDDNTNDAWRMYKAIRDVCAYYCVPVWNGMTEFGANPVDNTQFAELYMPDKLHPNDAGHVWYANRVESFIHSLAR